MVIRDICLDCGKELMNLPENKHVKPLKIVTVWAGKCQVCNVIRDGVCDLRDYGYPTIPEWFIKERRRKC